VRAGRAGEAVQVDRVADVRGTAALRASPARISVGNSPLLHSRISWERVGANARMWPSAVLPSFRDCRRRRTGEFEKCGIATSSGPHAVSSLWPSLGAWLIVVGTVRIAGSFAARNFVCQPVAAAEHGVARGPAGGARARRPWRHSGGARHGWRDLGGCGRRVARRDVVRAQAPAARRRQGICEGPPVAQPRGPAGPKRASPVPPAPDRLPPRAFLDRSPADRHSSWGAPYQSAIRVATAATLAFRRVRREGRSGARSGRPGSSWGRPAGSRRSARSTTRRSCWPGPPEHA